MSILLISIAYLSLDLGFNPNVISEEQFEEMFTQGDIAFLNIVNDQNLIRVKLHEQALQYPKYQDLTPIGKTSFSGNYHFEMEVTDMNAFRDRINQLNNPHGYSIIEGNSASSLLGWEIVPLLIYGLVLYVVIPGLFIYLAILGIRRLRRPSSGPIVLSQHTNGYAKPEKDLRNFPLKLGDRTVFKPTEEIACFYAQDNHVYLYDTDGKEHLVEYTLAELEAKLPKQFVRVHRSSIINSYLIQEIKKQPGSRFVIKLRDTNHKEIITGQSYAAPVKQLFEI
ncbi:MAG: LytTR family DNA-binding domain-containing protein [Bacteroidota bacterium]